MLTDKLRNSWQLLSGRGHTPTEKDAPAWLASLAFHLVLLLILAAIPLLLPSDTRVVLSALPPEATPDTLAEEFHFSPELPEDIGALSAEGVASSRPEAPIEARDVSIAYELESSASLATIQAIEFDRTILEAPNITEHLAVLGAGSVGTTGAAGAVDRITHEILLSLEQQPTLVAWLFDASGSLKAEREAIARRFDRVYQELSVIEASGNRAFRQHQVEPLLTSVASFGETIQMLTPRPTDDLERIKAAVRAVANDESGVENVFQSVQYLANEYRPYRTRSNRRNVMIVVFTDEAGEDLNALDDVVEFCRRFEIPVYVVGVPAPFGRLDAYVKYIDPDPNFDQSVQWLPVHQGPESVLPERIKLDFAGIARENDRFDSGFGPYGLCRLAYETGGLYFMVHPNREVGRNIRPWETASMSSHLAAFFDPRVMRIYRPDYLSVSDYLYLVNSNAASAALIEAAEISWTTPMENVRFVFEKIDEAQLARDLSTAQREAARIEPKIGRIVDTLSDGEAERSMLFKPRWQAGYDLAMGRALAVKVRTEGYNAMLALAKQGMAFRNESNDTWVLRPSTEISTNSALERDAESARMYLRRVIDEHPNTPWALVAQRELGQPLGWRWDEEFHDIAGRLARIQNAANRPPANRPQVPMVQPPPRRTPAL